MKSRIIGIILILSLFISGAVGKDAFSANSNNTIKNTQKQTTVKTKDVKIPKTGIYSGVYIPYVPESMGTLEMTEKDIGKKFSMVMFYQSFADEFPIEQLKDINNHGSIAHVVWEPWEASDINSTDFKDVINGKMDQYLKTCAAQVKSLKFPIFIRLAHEMNGNWYPWAGALNKNNPQMYIKFYRHVVDVFNKQGATNAIWVWCPNCSSVPADQKWNNYYNYYPGDNYADWIGIDGYNWGTSQDWSSWQSFGQIFDTMYNDMAKRYPKKPIMIGEFAASNQGGNKAQWIKETYAAIKKKYTKIKAAIWFDMNKETDWRIDSSADTLNAFKAAIKDKYFLESIKK